MPAIYNIGNTFLSVVWTLLGGINAIYLLIKMRKDKQ
ncbi:intracellular growth attenuator family protein [Campylobacter coli]|nr:intracellular growth attenuator family protein [Campylobacter coli]